MSYWRRGRMKRETRLRLRTLSMSSLSTLVTLRSTPPAWTRAVWTRNLVKSSVHLKSIREASIIPNRRVFAIVLITLQLDHLRMQVKEWAQWKTIIIQVMREWVVDKVVLGWLSLRRDSSNRLVIPDWLIVELSKSIATINSHFCKHLKVTKV